MGVYIKGMTAQQARMWLHYQMPFTFIVTNDDIIEIPEPHGDLIDRNKAISNLQSNECDGCHHWSGTECVGLILCDIGSAIYGIKSTPTVIEAEGEQ